MRAIDTRSLVERVYDYLLEQIITGAIGYGETINVRKIAGELSISTMPVREALKRLSLERVVTIKPRSSCTLRAPSRRMIREVYELREVLEEHAVRRCAAGGIEAAALDRLRAIVAEMRALDHETDRAVRTRKEIELDRVFHSGICALAGNEYMNEVHRGLSLHVNMTLIHERTDHALEPRYYENHAEILRSLESDPQRAVEVLRGHFARVRDLLLTSAEDASGPDPGRRHPWPGQPSASPRGNTTSKEAPPDVEAPARIAPP